MANVTWSSLEGQYFRMDVGTTKANALSATDNTILHLCTDGAIVMNGETIAERNPDLSGYMPKTGGTFAGNVTVGSTSATKTVTCYGSTYLRGYTQVGTSSSSASFYVYGTANLVANTTIGTSLVPKTFKVYGEASVTGSITTNSTLTIENASNANLCLSDTTSSSKYKVWWRNQGGYCFLLTSAKNGSSFSTLRPYVVELATGTVMIGNAALTVVASGNVTVAKTLTAASVVQTSTSDLRAKENLNADFDALAKLRELGDVYEFDYKADGKHSYGLIAQNVETTEFSSMVGHMDEEDTESLRYVNYLDPRLTALLIKSVRQLQDEVSALREQLKNVSK